MSVMSDLVWGPPPPSTSPGGANGNFHRFIAELKARPGEWAIYPFSQTAGTAAALKKMGCETTTRIISATPRKTTVYARWPS